MADLILKTNSYLVLTGVLFLLSCSNKITNQKLIFEYSGDCHKTYSVFRQVIDTMIIDQITLKNIISKDSSTHTQTYKRIGQNWYYQATDDTFHEWLSEKTFKSRDTIDISLKGYGTAFFVPRREHDANEEGLFVFDYFSNDHSSTIPITYFFNSKIGIVKIEDPFESKECRILELKSISND